ncbi:MAG: 4a-hydroxytetrahydrobiopterin dehydratase [Hyphomonadaceae bacterium]|nr:4a-hydroxytetrahydrobiopterin dehydratase [Hyphomonadaceae bacterium]
MARKALRRQIGPTPNAAGDRMRDTVVFVSYRRDDTGPVALALRAELDLRLAGVPVFVDLNRIQGGDAWPDVLEDALRKARVLIALIGPNWAGMHDGAAPRLHDPNDWVRRECARALAHPSGAILPVLVNGAEFPPEAALPDDLRKMRTFNALPLRTQSWDQDLRTICETLAAKFALRVKRQDEMLPPSSAIKRLVEPLSDEALEALKRERRLPGWTIETVHDTTVTGAVREFLCKKFMFAKDGDAFAFMHRMSGITRKLKHHPIIEAKYADVTVKLSTWDAGHYVTAFDVKMAIALDRLAKRWRQR